MLKIFIAVLLIVKACMFVAESSTEPELLIYPNQDHIIAPIKEILILACEGKTREEDKTMDKEFKYEEEMFTNMKWLNEYGEEITENVTRTESTLKLAFTNPSTRDSGKYKCTAVYSNLHRIVEAQVMVDFYELIKFEECPENQYLTLGETGYIRCRAVANPMPMIIWQKDGIRLNSKRIKVDEFVLTITSVSEEDTGIYTIEAFVKETGRNLLQNIHVNVITPPKINDLPEEFTVIQGENNTIKCGATGPEPLTYTWYNYRFENLSDTDNMGDRYFHYSYGHKVDHGLLTISKVTRSVEEYYICEASNPAGIDRAAVKIKIQRSEICDKPCSDEDFTAQFLPDTKRHLRKICTIGIENMKCRIQYSEICYGYDNSYLEDDYKLLDAYQELFCTENTLFHAVLLDNLNCFSKFVTNYTAKHCNMYDRSVVESRIQKFVGVLEEKGLSSLAFTRNHRVPFEFCTHVIDMFACTSLDIEDECGTIAKHVYIKIIQIILPIKDSECADFYPFLPEIVQLFKVEEGKERTHGDVSLLDNFI